VKCHKKGYKKFKKVTKGVTLYVPKPGVAKNQKNFDKIPVK
jgi:hypothetical protein